MSMHHEYSRYQERATVLSAMLFSGEEMDHKIVDFCHVNKRRFLAKISNISGTILDLTSTKSLYLLGKRYGGTQFLFPGEWGMASFGKTILAQTIGLSHATTLVQEFSGTAVELPNITKEFTDFYTLGFIVFHSRTGKSRNAVARSICGVRRNIYKMLDDESRQRVALDTTGAEDDFNSYWDAIFPNLNATGKEHG